jgi:hypothetical protein
MNQFEGLLLLLGLSFGLLLAGYWLAALLDDVAPATRLAVALLAGLASLLFAVSVVNFFQPLAGVWAALCLAPIGVTLARSRSRLRLVTDFAALRQVPQVGWLTGLGLASFGLLLWPMLTDGQSVFYDGTSNHDSFFWISAAEYLKRHSYMTLPVHSATEPLFSTTPALIGWHPFWGRMGAEGLLALSSSLAWTSPLKLYVYATACLLLPWIAGVYLSVRIFFTDRMSFAAKAALLVLQPIFAFFYSNANLPNLLGAIMGAAVVIAADQVLRATTGRFGGFRAWWGLLVLSLHGLACTYPEMLPFVALTCALLWLRPWFAAGPRAAWRPCAWVVAAVGLGVALNPATTIRAIAGFTSSYLAARANQSWSNMFEQLNGGQFFPALSTLCVTGALNLGVVSGMLLTLTLVVSLGLAWWRARDRFGAAAGFAGSAALAAYTAVTGFNYGWQKTAQFAGVFFTAALPVAVVEAQFAAARAAGVLRWLARAALIATVGWVTFALAMNCREIYKTSTRKVLSQDWFSLRETSYGPLRNGPVLVDAASFRMPFFYSMWAAYFLPESRLYFGARGDEGGGYLHGEVAREGLQPMPEIRAVLVGRAWAESFDANSPRILSGREFALLQKSNRVMEMKGVYPLAGPPDYSSTYLELLIVPHSAGNLVFHLGTRGQLKWPAGAWQITRHTESSDDVSIPVSGPPPWSIKVPLVAGHPNRITAAFSVENRTSEPFPFAIGGLQIESQP